MGPVLDETIDSLESADREAIVLRFFERRDFRSVGAALGISDDAAQKRVSRALEKLRVLLADRGVALSVTLLASFMASRVVSAAPVGLAAEVSGAVLVGTVAGAGLAGVLTKWVGAAGFKMVAITTGVIATVWLVLSTITRL